MSTRAKTILIIFLLVLLALFSFCYTVTEGSRALVLRLGKLRSVGRDNVTYIAKPGLHVKLPLLDRVKMFDIRLQNMDIKSSPIVTANKKNVIVDYYVRWEISDVPLFYKRTSGDVQQAQTLLEQQLNDALRAQFGRRDISEVVSDARSVIMTALKQQAKQGAERLGIRVVDVRIKGIDLPQEVSGSVFERMRAERFKVATELRAKGRADGEAIRANADGQFTVIVAQAKADANKLRAAGDEQAAKIYSQAYSKNPEFYAFYRSMDAYVKTFSNKQDVLLLTPDSDFLRYFNNNKGQKTK
jgi:membrane protease subunit HflC